MMVPYEQVQEDYARLNDRIEELEGAIKVLSQMLIEVDGAYRRGPEWYTKGASGLRTQVRMWLDKSYQALKDLDNH